MPFDKSVAPVVKEYHPEIPRFRGSLPHSIYVRPRPHRHLGRRSLLVLTFSLSAAWFVIVQLHQRERTLCFAHTQLCWHLHSASVCCKKRNQKKDTVLPGRGACHPPRRQLNTAALRAASGLTCPTSFLQKEGRGGRPRSKRKGSARIFVELNGKKGRPQTRVPSRAAWSVPTSLLWGNASRLFCKKKKLSKELHSDSEMEVPLCTFSPFRRHPLGVFTWDLLRFSTYQQHTEPNCYASCRVLTPAAHCDCVCLFGRSSILGTVLGGCSWSNSP